MRSMILIIISYGHPKYRKSILSDDIQKRVKQLFYQIAQNHDIQEVRRQLRGEEFWQDGYFAPTVGDIITVEMIRKYIQYHQNLEKSPQQLEWF